VSSSLSNGCLTLEIPIELGEPKAVAIIVDNPTAAPISSVSDIGSESAEGLHLSLSFFPPLLLDVALPPSYPLHAPPEILSLSATHSWLPHQYIEALRCHLPNTWRAGETVLYDWVEFLRNAEFLQSPELPSMTGADKFIRSVAETYSYVFFRTYHRRHRSKGFPMQHLTRWYQF